MSSVTPALAGTAVSLLFTKELIKFQREAREKITPFADRALVKAKQQFATEFTSLRNLDNSVYSYVRSLPDYSPNTNAIYRGSRTGYIAATNLVKTTAFGISRYNNGDREAAINSGLAAGMIRSGEIAADAGNFEDTLVAAYAQLKWVSLSNSARGGVSTPSRAFADTATSLIRQTELKGTAAENSVASLVYLGTSAFLNRKRDGTRSPNINTLTSENSSTQGLSDFAGLV